jgi:small-conductance mechanosensitive channel
VNFLDTIVLNNSIQDWGLAFLIALAAIVAFPFMRSIIVQRVAAFAHTTATDWDNFVADVLQRTRGWFLLLVGLYLGSWVLEIPAEIGLYVDQLMVIGFFIQAGLWGSGAIRFWVTDYRQEKLAEDASRVTAVAALGFIGALVVWVIVLLLILDNLGVEITSLIAGLGISGIAVALAVQNILGDLFASLSIILDKPFVIGDFIIIGDFMGTIENIGLRTTRIRSLSGEQIVFSNTDLVQSRLRNYKQMNDRRIIFTFGVLYQTSPEKVEAIPGIVRGLIEAQAETRFDRAHFKEFGSYALSFEVVYYMLTPDYLVYMDTQQAINLGLFRHFAEEGIEFAYPTQTVFIESDGAKDREYAASSEWEMD